MIYGQKNKFLPSLLVKKKKEKKRRNIVINCLIRENNLRLKYVQWYIEWEGQGP